MPISQLTTEENPISQNRMLITLCLGLKVCMGTNKLHFKIQINEAKKNSSQDYKLFIKRMQMNDEKILIVVLMEIIDLTLSHESYYYS